MAKMVKDISALQWTPRLESQLEDILIRNAFDFKAAAKDFQHYVNNQNQNPDAIATLFFKIDHKVLQIKWTDIEIRKHVIPGQTAEIEGNNNAEPEESVEDDLPPLLETPEISEKRQQV